MNNLILTLMGSLLFVLTACTPMIYGVPQPTWERMSEPERIEAMEGYNQRQTARQYAIAEQNRKQAIYLEQQRQQQAAVDKSLRNRVESIYRGAGNYGDLLRVRVEKGVANFNGQVREYDPVSFQIANGETKSITIATTKHRTVKLDAYYDGATLFLDGNSRSRKTELSQLNYDKRWSRGFTYSNVYTNNKAKLKGAEVTIEIVGDNRRGDRYPAAGSTTIIINQQPTEQVIQYQRPTQLIIKEQPQRVILKDNSRAYSSQQRQRNEQLKKERLAIEKQRVELEHDQAIFDAEQRELEKEHYEINEELARIKNLKDETDRAKKITTREQKATVRERKQVIKQLEKSVTEKELRVTKKEQLAAAKEKQLKEKNQHVQKQVKEIEEEEKKLAEEVIEPGVKMDK